MRRALIVKVLGKSELIIYKILEQKVSELLGLELGFEMIDLDHGFFLVRVYKDFLHVLPNGPWVERGHYLTVCKRRPKRVPSKSFSSTQKRLSLGASPRDPDFIF